MSKATQTGSQSSDKLLRSFCLALSVILSTSFGKCHSALSKSSPVTFEICCVGPRANQSDAVVVLQFRNQTKSRVSVPFSAMFGKGGIEKNTRQFVNLTKRETDFNEGGDFCQITYKWSRPGKPDVAGNYESNQQTIKISPMATESLRVPIKCPVEPGTYLLTVNFDNRNLQAVLNTYNQTQHTEANVYFSASTESMFKIHEINH